MAYALNWESDGVVIEFRGLVSIRDLEQATVGYEADSRFDDLHWVIADYSGIDGCDAHPAEIESVWVMDFGARRSNPRVRKVVVTTRPEVLAMASHYASHLGGAFEVKSVATRAEARAWLAQA